MTSRMKAGASMAREHAQKLYASSSAPRVAATGTPSHLDHHPMPKVVHAAMKFVSFKINYADLDSVLMGRFELKIHVPLRKAGGKRCEQAWLIL